VGSAGTRNVAGPCASWLPDCPDEASRAPARASAEGRHTTFVHLVPG
jgi:hypothetical protein